MDYGLLLATSHASHPERMSGQRRLYESLRAAILDGRLAPGARLTASRVLAAELGMARNSVLYAYERLASEGYIAGDRHGTSVARLGLSSPRLANLLAADRAATAPGLSRRAAGLGREDPHSGEMLPFVPGVPALDAFPLARWRRSIERAWRSLSARHLGQGQAAGQPALRHAIAEYLRVARGVRCEAAQVFVTAGTQSGLDLCARLLADAGDTAWVEDPGYPGAHAAFRSASLRLESIPVDADGLAPPAGHWQRVPPRLVYITPSHQYPLGSVLSLERRLALLAAARAAGAWIIEDDYDSEFRRDGMPVPAVQGLEADAPVIYLGTFSKTLFPALRLGFMVVPPQLATLLAGTVGAIPQGGHVAEQLALAEFLDSGAFTSHLRRMRRLYAQRRDALQDALARHLGTRLTVSASAGGMHLSARLEMPLADTTVSAAAAARGLALRPLSRYLLPGTPQAQYNGFVFGYANVAEDAVDGAVCRLARVLDEVAGARPGPG
ncbi:DNA-binding protein [Cupriavidus sp. USMAHM13]|uniref:MocR-like pyridoxine biosynthesis transcription factor PdxR n=1 Tax=Cupriavidus sp. USMAHM13 TaxID=1389192 RepID=UPI0008A68597|nr:PLP-dependent aminotransferase family protein [Cupriavidus sp. USMAHM13]AOY99366.1 DNA-binding protein [Cupriavidus sp. USMAHM13]